ncbi:MAG: response regulator [Cytophagaceae bacterium]|nr:response regulator [Cytophagaceae bacterium]
MKRKLPSVLLIDDDSVTNFLNKKVIEQAKITEHVEVKLNGKEALSFLTDKESSPALILLDINMPVMDGWEFLQAYQQEALDKKNKTNIILLSTSSNPDDIERAKSLPFVCDFKSKPLTSEILKEIIHNYFEEYL